MADSLVEVLEIASNCAVVRTRGRQYPGLIVQGDTLFSFYSLANRIRRLVEKSRHDGALDLAIQLEDALSGYLSAYETVLAREGIEIPYAVPKEIGSIPENDGL